MPIAPTHPGIYNEDIPGGVHVITGTAVSTRAFGWTRREPVDNQYPVSGTPDHPSQANA